MRLGDAGEAVTGLQLAGTVLLTIAAGLAILLAHGDRKHRAVAGLLVGAAVANSARIVLQELVVIPSVIASGGDPARGIPPLVPLHGWARAAAHVDHSIQFTWCAGLAACALWVFGVGRLSKAGPVYWWFAHHHGRLAIGLVEGVKPHPGMALRALRAGLGVLEARMTYAPPCLVGPALVWAAMTAFFAATYPETRPLHRQGYLLADMLAIGTGFAAFVGWLRRRESSEGMPLPKLCVLLILAMDGLAAILPHLVPGYYPGIDRAQAVLALLYGILTLLQGGSLWLRSETR